MTVRKSTTITPLHSPKRSGICIPRDTRTSRLLRRLRPRSLGNPFHSSTIPRGESESLLDEPELISRIVEVAEPITESPHPVHTDGAATLEQSVQATTTFDDGSPDAEQGSNVIPSPRLSSTIYTLEDFTHIDIVSGEADRRSFSISRDQPATVSPQGHHDRIGCTGTPVRLGDNLVDGSLIVPNPYCVIDPPNAIENDPNLGHSALISGKSLALDLNDTSEFTGSYTSAEEQQQHEVAETGVLLQENQRLLAEVRELRDALSKQSSPPNSQDEARPGGQGSVQRSARNGKPKRPLVLSSVIQDVTLRDLVLKRTFKRHSRTSSTTDTGTITLDTPLSAAQATHFTQVMDDIAAKNLPLPIVICAVCHLPKFKHKDANSPKGGSYLSEIVALSPGVPVKLEDFNPIWSTTDCCRKFVCNTCLSAAVVEGIRHHWWYDLAHVDSPWLKCPVPCCTYSLPLQYNLDILDTLEELGVPNAVAYTQQFERANQLRSALQALPSWPGKREARLAIALHDRLVKHTSMRPLLENVSTNTDTNTMPPRVELLPIDTADGQATLQIPIFTHLLRPRVPRDCIVCAETHDEFTSGYPQLWNRAIKGFTGEWTWRILFFPTAEILPDCQHEFHICRNCLATHISTQIESQSRNAVDNIACPTPDCSHKFTHAEIRNLASPETFAKYDRYAVLNTISLLSNFRWCLREGCTFGSLYDDPSTTSTQSVSSHDPNHILCTECTFSMCYTCQTPWHHSLTCAEYESLRAHGDPRYMHTQKWISQNTKGCPGADCGVPVQKGSGCFHMTCSECKHEFCWECLANWDDIVVYGRFRLEGHRVGCYFRGEDAVPPTQVLGRDLERGLTRLGAGPVAA
ncbi:Uu.00g132200.m01.CDS01 [Anthostomella pinea]|uniref:RBR-type E3 ubiquitin transferase n=1 Tax=Anthostomella pinea TaxID=933095 RepID=A0AAI8VJM3_9PEZI|nr:Uu.00g132200.m01.CDS01 [Anthostomella pinea]